MAKTSAKASRKVTEIEPFDKTKVNLAKAKPEPSAKQLQKLVSPPSHFPFLPIETLTPTRTVGLGRTNLTLIATIFQTDATMPRASFDLRLQPRKPVAQMHFQPSAYGIASTATYIMEFTIQTLTQSTFTLDGGPFGTTILNAGTKTLNGLTRVALVFPDLPPASEVFGFLEQRSGTQWNWFSTSVRFPDLVNSPF